MLSYAYNMTNTHSGIYELDVKKHICRIYSKLLRQGLYKKNIKKNEYK
jgi:hypothetical protein